MEDLNYYYANYSRWAEVSPTAILSLTQYLEYITTLLLSVKGRAICIYIQHLFPDAPLTIGRTKLSLSHALSQSVKISLVSTCHLVVRVEINAAQFEELISSTIEETKDIPEIISETGKIGMPHKGSFR